MPRKKDAAVPPVKRGRKPKPVDDPMAQITVRISEKAKLGLDLLSRAQHQTLGQVIEWSINLALRSTLAAPGDWTLAEHVDALWRLESEPRRIWMTMEIAPQLLDWEQRSAWSLVGRCPDCWLHVERDENGKIESVTTPALPYLEQVNAGEVEPNFEVIEEHWHAIREAGIALVRSGDMIGTYRLDAILDGSALKHAILR